MMMDEQAEKKYLGVIVAEVKSSARELYPLAKNYPMGLLPVGIKKLIVYQLQALASLDSIDKVVIILSSEDKALRPYIQSQFLQKHKNYPHKIQFFPAGELANTFISFKELLTSVKQNYEGYIVVHGDTIVGTPLTEFVKFHEEKNSDLSLLLKAKRQLAEQEKKLPEGEIETDLDNVLIGQKDQVLFIDLADELDNNGVTLNPSIYGQIRRASFKRVLDTKVYLFGSKVCQIIMELSTDDIYDIKPELIQFLVEHQTNRNLLNISKQLRDEQLRPLKIYAHLKEQQAYIRKISTKKIYENLNFDSLLRGARQRDLLLPTTFSDSAEFQNGTNWVLGQNVVVGNSSKIRRSVIGANCKVGKNVEIFNSILLEGVEIKDNCKINESVLGAGTVVGQNVQLKNSYSECGCRIADSLKIDGQTLIRTQ